MPHGRNLFPARSHPPTSPRRVCFTLARFGTGQTRPPLRPPASRLPTV